MTMQARKGTRIRAADERPVSLSGARILVVEDDADARELLVEILSDVQGIVTAAGSVQEALAVLAGSQVDVIISDVGLPGEDGYSFIRKVRTLERADRPRIPAIATTAYTRPEDRELAFQAGFNFHVGKPVYPDALVKLIARILLPTR